MININYSKRSKFLLPMGKSLENFSTKISIDLSQITSQKGYEGEYLIEINESHFSANFLNNDPTRFPQRIRVAATVLSRLKFYGKYIISHKNKILTIQKA
ncbi:hypothetical protein [Aliarcobacter cibarius]|jgi:hypothetical protein|uniref:hypothetical protein n=1 Tax=Aliarcobacter cibarius TaxID=255507 RepID=UPI0010FDA117|nr:hypothetical protein [Aliarcobacter cibarius]TLT04539.1 hypothetical protein FE248_02630 [Aliarcobacter cibarius]